MSEHLDVLNRQRGSLLSLGGLLLTLMCAALVLIIGIEDGGQFSFERRWPTLVGLVGLVLLFVLYVQHKHRQLAALELQLRNMAVREATIQARFSGLSFLFDISTQIQLRLDLPSMLELAVQRLIPCLDAHQASIMLHDPESGLLQVKAVAGVDSGLVRDAAVKPGEGIAGHVFSTGEALILTQEIMRKRFPSEAKPGRTIAAGLCVPMRFRGTPMGVISVTRTSGDPFGTDDARMLEAFAEHCAATVLKTHHHHEMLQHMRRAA